MHGAEESMSGMQLIEAVAPRTKTDVVPLAERLVVSPLHHGHCTLGVLLVRQDLVIQRQFSALDCTGLGLGCPVGLCDVQI